MGIYKYIREAWKTPSTLAGIQKDRLIKWRREPVTLRIKRPTRLDRARSLGYKAKQGIILVRQRVSRGGRQRPTIRKGRRPKRFGQRLDLAITYQTVAEQRASSKYPNCEVLNSYEVGKDGNYAWFEVILLDRAHPQILADSRFSNVAQKRGRISRGLTSSARKSKLPTKK